MKIAADYGYNLKVTGAPSMPYLRITDDESLMLHQDWCGECTKRGAYFTSHHNWFILDGPYRRGYQTNLGHCG